MTAAAVSTLACPPRRSTRLAHAHSTPPNRQHHQRHKSPRHPLKPTPDPEPEHDDSSDPENELTPRALRALKRQRLALDPDGLPFSTSPHTKKRRKDLVPLPRKRPSSPRHPLTPKRPQSTHWQAHTLSPFSHSHSSHSIHSIANPASMPEPIKDPPSDPADENRPTSPACHQLPSATTFRDDLPIPSRTPPPKPELSIPLTSISAESSAATDPSSSTPLTPLTPLTPSPESSPLLPGHDRHVLPLSPPHDPLPPASLDTLLIPSSPDPTPSVPGTLTQQQLSTDSFTPPPLSTPTISLDPALDTLIPFEGLHPPFDPELSVQIPPPSCQPSTPPQLQGLELQDQFHSFPQPQLYVPRNPVFVRDREINIWKLACQERVDYLLRRYGLDYIKALVQSEAHSVSQETRSSPSSGTLTADELCPAPPSQTKFRLYTPASYTYSSTSWGSTPGTRKSFPVDDADDMDPSWPMDDGDWADADVDMEDEDEDDYDDDDDAAEVEVEREGEATLEAVQDLVIADVASLCTSRVDTQATIAIQVDEALGKSDMMEVDDATQDDPLVTKATVISEAPGPDPPHSVPSTPDPSSSAVTQPILPSLSSLHVPLLSEPPRAFMGRGTPPDRRRLIEWSGSGRFATNGMGPPLYLSPVPQRHTSPDVGIVPMAVDSQIHPPPPHTAHTHGEWTSFLYSMLEGDGVGVGTSVGAPPHHSEPTWYELGLGSVPPVVPENALQLPLSHTHPHTHGRTPPVEQPVEDGNNSSSTLRFALG